MTFPTHELTGVVLSLAYMKFSGDTFLFPLLISSFSSLLPDIDEPQSRAGRKIPILSWLIKKFLGHRGATHSLFLMFIFTLVFFFILYYFGFPLFWGIYFLIGYLGHLLMDLPSARGIPLFWPFSKQMYSLGHIKVKYRRIIDSKGNFCYVPSRGERLIQLLLLLCLFYLSFDFLSFYLKDLFEILSFNGFNYDF